MAFQEVKRSLKFDDVERLKSNCHSYGFDFNKYSSL
jgi:hypothetical protein